MVAPIISKITKAPVVVIEITLGLFAGYIGLLYDNEILKIIVLLCRLKAKRIAKKC